MNVAPTSPVATREPTSLSRNPPFSPDPLLSANIYCAGALDAVILGAVAPFWKTHGDGLERGLWMLRYGRGGEHLKVRLHAPAAAYEELHGGLWSAVRSCLADLREVSAPARRASEPPIDAEDEVQTHPDRSMLWTTYRRHPISLGGEIFLRDDGYCSRFTHCLARGCERVLAALEPGATGMVSHSQRQNALIKLLLSGLTALDFDAERCAIYLAYHRDSALRALAAFNSAKPEAVRGVLKQIDARTRSLKETRETLAAAAASCQDDPASAEDDPHQAWNRALTDLFAYNTALCENSAYHLDPLADDPALSVLVKVFQGLSNPLGLTLLDESFTLHLLLSAFAPKRAAVAPYLPTLERPQESVR